MTEIYAITNSVDGKQYVGKTTDGHAARFCKHVYNAINYDSGCRYLQRAIRVHGADSFSVEVLEEVEDDQAFEAEGRWVEKLGTMAPEGYNLAAPGWGGYISEEANAKRRETMKRRKLSWEIDELWVHEDGREFEGSAADLMREFGMADHAAVCLRSVAHPGYYAQTYHGWRCMTPHEDSGLPMYQHKRLHGHDLKYRTGKRTEPKGATPRPASKRKRNPAARRRNVIHNWTHPDHGDRSCSVMDLSREFDLHVPTLREVCSPVYKKRKSLEHRGWTCPDVYDSKVEQARELDTRSNGAVDWIHPEHGRRACLANHLVKEFGLNSAAVSKVYRGKANHHKGWRLA